jgi:hypothetical protein
MVSLKVNGFDVASNGFKILQNNLTSLNAKLQETKAAANYTYHYLEGQGSDPTSGQENGTYNGAVIYR